MPPECVVCPAVSNASGVPTPVPPQTKLPSNALDAGKPPKATAKPYSGHILRSTKPHQSHTKATPKPPPCDPHATLMRGASVLSTYSLRIPMVFPSYSHGVLPLWISRTHTEPQCWFEAFRPAVGRPLCLRHRSDGSRVPGSGRLVWCDRTRAGGAGWHAGRGRGPCPW